MARKNCTLAGFYCKECPQPCPPLPPPEKMANCIVCGRERTLRGRCYQCADARKKQEESRRVQEDQFAQRVYTLRQGARPIPVGTKIKDMDKIMCAFCEKEIPLLEFQQHILNHFETDFRKEE